VFFRVVSLHHFYSDLKEKFSSSCNEVLSALHFKEVCLIYDMKVKISNDMKIKALSKETAMDCMLGQIALWGTVLTLAGMDTSAQGC